MSCICEADLWAKIDMEIFLFSLFGNKQSHIQNSNSGVWDIVQLDQLSDISLQTENIMSGFELEQGNR